MVQALFWIWLAGVLLFASAGLVDEERRSEGSWALALLGWIFWPVVVIGVALYIAWERFFRR